MSLRPEDLAFFESALTGSSDRSVPKEAPQVNHFTDFRQAPEDDDEFGEFVDPQPEPEAPISTNPTLVDINTDNSVSETATPIRPNQLIDTSDVKPSSQSPAPKQSVSKELQKNASDLASFDGPIRFGQHLVTKNTPSGLVTKPSSISPQQWSNLVSNSDGRTPTPPVHTKSTAQTDTQQKPETTIQSDSKDDEWGNNDDDDDDDFDDFESFVSGPPSVPRPHELLIFIDDKVIPTIDTLINSMVPLEFALRKRVLARPETQKFLEGYLIAIDVSARIMAGRNRRAIDGPERVAADKESRRVQSIWETKSTRLRSLVRDRVIPVLDSKVTFPINVSGGTSTCDICGLAKNEVVKGQDRKEEWISARSAYRGHKSCIAFWENRDKFGSELDASWEKNRSPKQAILI